MAKSNVLPLTQPRVEHIRRTATLPEMTFDEVVAECRAKEDRLIEADAELSQIADAVWPDGAERPEDLDGGATANDVIAGIVSLHELCDRLYAENGELRDRLEARD